MSDKNNMSAAQTQTPTDTKVPPIQPPPQHPAATTMPGTFNDSKSNPDDIKSSDMPGPSTEVKAQQNQGSGFLKRALSKDNRRTAQRFFSAYAQTWIGISPIWLMGEAVIPGKKVGSQFNKGRKNLLGAAEEVRMAVATSGKDVVVIIDEKLRGSGEGGRQIAERTAEVIKAAGENAILVVTSSLDKLSSSQSPDSKGKQTKSTLQGLDLRKLAQDPELKRTMQKHSRDALVLLDNTLKNPVVVTGVNGFARSRGIPHADALLRLASLGLGRILRTLPEEVQEEVSERLEAHIEEIDAEELERRSTQEERIEADSISKASEKAQTPKVEGAPPGDKDDPYAEMRKKNECLIM